MAHASDRTVTLTADGAPIEETRATATLSLLTHGGQIGPDLSRHLLRHVDAVLLGRGAAGPAAEAERSHVGGRPTLILRLADGRVSTRHAALRRTPEGWALEDVGSKNGTRLDDQPVHRPTLLADGAVIQLGRTALIFRAATPLPLLAPVDTTARALSAPLPAWRSFHGPLVAALDALAALATADVPVLALGETGVGKEIVARGVHALSGRPGELIAVNCAAVSPSLAEAEFFGHARGAFTGAERARLGWIRSADRGTLLLDEVADLRPAGQAVLLRALETRAVTPVGGERPVEVDFRLVAATNCDLDAAVEAGRFRGDLRARLGALRVTLPPLRERPEDIGLLAGRILGHDAGLTAEAAARLARQPWPGNVRDLVHSLRLARARAGAEPIDAAHLALDDPPDPRPAPRPVLDAEQRAHRDALVAALAEAGGNIAEVGRKLGAHRQSLHRWFARYGIDPDDHR